MKKMLQRGFTLIELLVVIAIIGILAAVVLASLNDARDSAGEASAKGSLTSVRNQAELYYNDNGYAYDTNNTNDTTGVCAGGNEIATLITAASDAVGGGTTACFESDAAYAVAVQLDSTDANSYFCVDSTGYAGEGAVPTTTNCP